MTDIAKLGIEIETKGADDASRKLSELEQAAKRAADGADKLGEQAGKADRVMQDLGGTAERLEGMFDRPFAQLVTADVIVRGAAIAVQTLTAAVQRGITEFAQYEKATSELVQSLERVGNTTGFTLAQIQSYASELESVTGVAEESIMRIAQVLNRTGSVSGDQFQRLTKLSLDLASAMGGSAVDSAEQLARALKDPERAISMLRRQFADFDPVVADAIERLAQAGDKAGAAAMMFDYLERTVGGSAAAATDTLAGAWSRFNDALGDSARAMIEVSGAGVGLKNALDTAAVSVTDLTENMIAGARAASDYITGVVELSKSLVGLENDTIKAHNATNLLRLLWSAASSGGLDFARTLMIIRGEYAMQDAMLEKQRQGVENMRGTWTRMNKIVSDGAEYFRRLGSQIAENANAEARELSLIRMSTQERAKAEAGLAAYEKTKQAMIRATGAFGAAERAEAERAKQSAIEMHQLNVQLRAAEQAHTKAASATSRHVAAARELRDPVAELTSDLERYIKALEQEAELAGLTGVARDQRASEMRIEEMILRELGAANDDLANRYNARASAAIQASADTTAALEAEQRALEDAQRLQQESIALFTDFAASVISGSEDMGEALGRLLVRLVEVYLQMQLMQAMGGGGGLPGVGGLLGGFGNFIGGMFGLGSGGNIDATGMSELLAGLSRGGVASRGELVQFGRGGTVSKPTMRSMALMGEAGPEAILPLRRDAAGNLGVSSSGDSGVKVVVQNIDQRKNGAKVETEQTRGQNGEIVIRTYIRDEVRRAMSDGSLDKDFSKNFNLGRNPTRRS